MTTIVPGVPIVVTPVVEFSVDGVPPLVNTFKLIYGLAEMKPLTVKFPPIVAELYRR